MIKYNHKRAEVTQMSILEGFNAFNFSEGAPYVSVTKNGVTFNKGVIYKLKKPEYVVLLFNDKTRQMGIKVCDANTPNAFAFYNKEKKSNLLSVRWNMRDLLNTISEMMEWNLEENSYKIAGTLYAEEGVMIFDLEKADIIK